MDSVFSTYYDYYSFFVFWKSVSDKLSVVISSTLFSFSCTVAVPCFCGSSSPFSSSLHIMAIGPSACFLAIWLPIVPVFTLAANISECNSSYLGTASSVFCANFFRPSPSSFCFQNSHSGLSSQPCRLSPSALCLFPAQCFSFYLSSDSISSLMSSLIGRFLLVSFYDSFLSSLILREYCPSAHTTCICINYVSRIPF